MTGFRKKTSKLLLVYFVKLQYSFSAYDENSDTIDESGENMAMGGEGGDNMIGMIGSPSGYSNE